MTLHEPPTGLHLVGSVPLPNNEQVFEEVSRRLGSHVWRMSDGETGERLKWVRWLNPVFDAHPRLQRVEGVMPWPLYGLREGADIGDVELGELGYAREALASYEVFARLKRDGVIPPHVRFQVGLPASFDVASLFLPDLTRAVRPEVERALRVEMERILAHIPHRELAIQREVCLELAVLEGLVPVSGTVQDFAGWVAEDVAGIPEDVDLGFHLCYGDYEQSHFVEPRDTGLLVDMANAITGAVDHDVRWFHMPVPQDRDDDDYFEPLGRLTTSSETDICLGLVHDHDLEGTVRRMAAARRHIARFGVATECGFGRRDPETIPDLLKLHAALCRGTG